MKAKKKSLWARIKRYRFAYYFILPTALAMLFLHVSSILQGIYMSFQVGIAQWMVIAGVLMVVIIFLLMKNKWARKFLKRIRLEIDLKKQDKTILIFGLVMFFFTLPLMLADGEWFFKLINKVVVIDIPWKFLAVEVFLAAMLTGILVVG